jgi:glycosyltransferase involved in cell wall biosynthesis
MDQNYSLVTCDAHLAEFEMTAPPSRNEDTVSVVIPVRNRENSVEFAVRSALSQTRQVDEIIIINDGSTDGTARILDELAESSSIVKPIHLPSASGAAAARNIGLTRAKSAWIAFLDSDDVWLPDKIQCQMDAANKSEDILGVFTGIRYVPRAGSIQ